MKGRSLGIALFLSALTQSAAAPALADPRSLETEVYTLDTAAPIVGVMEDGAAIIRLEDDSYHRVRLDAEGLSLTPTIPPLSPPPSGDASPMPDEVVVTGEENIRAAWFRSPTTRYGHAVLGDNIEAGGLGMRLADGHTETLELPSEAVFEDRVPRLVDMDGDGLDEVMAVKAYLSAGAALVLIEPSDRGLRTAAESDPIGIPYRWLNPIGIGDFDADGRTEAAVIVTPHLGVRLQLYEWRGEKLVEDLHAFDFSNHGIGSPELGLSTVADLDGDGTPEIIVPDGSRVDLRIVDFKGGGLRDRARVKGTGTIEAAVITHDLDGDGDPEVLLAPGGRLTVVDFPD